MPISSGQTYPACSHFDILDTNSACFCHEYHFLAGAMNVLSTPRLAFMMGNCKQSLFIDADHISTSLMIPRMKCPQVSKHWFYEHNLAIFRCYMPGMVIISRERVFRNQVCF